MNEKMTKEWIIKLLSEYNKEDINKFASYCIRLKLDWKNTWMQKKTEENMADLFKRVHSEWLKFDWVHVTLQSRWINYDYVAYKNKMLIAYPESIIDINIVYEWDDFKFTKIDWKITYNHEFKDPFSQKDENIKWGYCIIKNTRWEFITLLSKADFEKHRKVAKTDFIWKAWYKEMCMKTLFKKATKVHYDDIYQTMEEEDNKQYDLSKLTEENREKVEKQVLDKYNLNK